MLTPFWKEVTFFVSSDRLDELEKDKARLSEQLISQQKESMAREIDMLRKRLVSYHLSNCLSNRIILT